jgi:hypothetical protein
MLRAEVPWNLHYPNYCQPNIQLEEWQRLRRVFADIYTVDNADSALIDYL